MNDLTLSAKFSNYLSEQGILFPLVYHLRKFRERENYPFELKDERVSKLAVFKGLCEMAASRTAAEKKDNPLTTDDLIKQTEAVTKKLMQPIKQGTFEKAKPSAAENMLKGRAEKGWKQPKPIGVDGINAQLQQEAEKQLKKEQK